MIFGRSEDGYKALHQDDGSLIDAGDTSASSRISRTRLDAIASEGARLFYEGEIARTHRPLIAAIGDGMLTLEDLRTYRAIERKPLLRRDRRLAALRALRRPLSGGRCSRQCCSPAPISGPIAGICSHCGDS